MTKGLALALAAATILLVVSTLGEGGALDDIASTPGAAQTASAEQVEPAPATPSSVATSAPVPASAMAGSPAEADDDAWGAEPIASASPQSGQRSRSRAQRSESEGAIAWERHNIEE